MSIKKLDSFKKEESFNLNRGVEESFQNYLDKYRSKYTTGLVLPSDSIMYKVCNSIDLKYIFRMKNGESCLYVLNYLDDFDTEFNTIDRESLLNIFTNSKILILKETDKLLYVVQEDKIYKLAKLKDTNSILISDIVFIRDYSKGDDLLLKNSNDNFILNLNDLVTIDKKLRNSYIIFNCTYMNDVFFNSINREHLVDLFKKSEITVVSDTYTCLTLEQYGVQYECTIFRNGWSSDLYIRFENLRKLDSLIEQEELDFIW